MILILTMTLMLTLMIMLTQAMTLRLAPAVKKPSPRFREYFRRASRERL
jgi:hypothetical protein